MAYFITSETKASQFVENTYTSDDIIEEQWKEIKGFPDYMVSNIGRVKSTKRYKSGRILKPLLNNGYLAVILTRKDDEGNYTRTFKQIHILEAEAFLENPDPEHYTQVNHINEKKSDNTLTNLEWCTPSGNISYGSRISKACNTTLYRQSNYIKATSLTTGDVYLFEDTQSAYNTLGIYTTHINLALRHLYASGINTVKGYRFEYQDKKLINVA